MIKVAFSFKCEGTGKIELFSQGTDGFINMRYGSLITVDRNIKNSTFCFLGCKVLVEEGDY